MDDRQPGPSTLRSGFPRHPGQPLVVALGPRPLPPHDRTSRPKGSDVVDTGLGELLDHHLGALPLGHHETHAEAAGGRRLPHRRFGRFDVAVAPQTSGSPRAGAVTDDEWVTGRESHHPFEVMTVRLGQLGMSDIGHENKRSAAARNRPVHVPAPVTRSRRSPGAPFRRRGRSSPGAGRVSGPVT